MNATAYRHRVYKNIDEEMAHAEDSSTCTTWTRPQRPAAGLAYARLASRV
jgi:hypothetical protein